MINNELVKMIGGEFANAINNAKIIINQLWTSLSPEMQQIIYIIAMIAVIGMLINMMKGFIKFIMFIGLVIILLILFYNYQASGGQIFI